MINEKEKQKLINDYINDKHTVDEVYGFCEALDRVITLLAPTTFYVIMENRITDGNTYRSRPIKHFLNVELANEYLEKNGETLQFSDGTELKRYWLKEEDLYS